LDKILTTIILYLSRKCKAISAIVPPTTTHLTPELAIDLMMLSILSSSDLV